MLRELPIRLGAVAARVLLYDLVGPSALGPEDDYWNAARRRCVGAASRFLGPVLHTDREIRDSEFVGTVDEPLADLEERLWAAGFHRNPVAAVKTRDGDPEVGSWVRRETPAARRQLHVMLFEGGDGGVDVYAHEEFSSLHPDVAVRHYYGVDQQEARGVEATRRLLFED